MKFVISYVKTVSGCDDIGDKSRWMALFLEQFRVGEIIEDESQLQTIVENVMTEVDKLNAAYPDDPKLVFKHLHVSEDCEPEDWGLGVLLVKPEPFEETMAVGVLQYRIYG